MKFTLYCFSIFILFQSYCNAQSKVVNVYSARQEVLMRELINSFEQKENIKVNIIFSKANQLNRAGQDNSVLASLNP